jgi:hypothetical protein
MLFYRNTFPEFLEAISIGPDPSFLEKNTTYCEFVSSFPQEVELMYAWKSVKRSSNPMASLRKFIKTFLLNAPDLDVQTINFFVRKVNVYPEYYSSTVKAEVEECFKYVADNNYSISNFNVDPIVINNRPMQNDSNFLDKLAKLMQGCKAPCNYFKPPSTSIGTLGDFGRALSDSASILAQAGDDLLHAPTNIATNVMNKIKPQVRTEFFKLKILTQNLYRDGVKPFFSKADRERVKEGVSSGKTPDSEFYRMPLTGDTQSYFTTSTVHSQIQSKIQRQLGDCYRMYTNAMRFNAYDPIMNSAYAKRKYVGVKNGNVKSLIDILGGLAPAQYAAETTYVNTLDVPKVPNYRTTDDSPTAPKYDTYDGPSKGAEQVITGGTAATGNLVEAAGAGTETPPTNGKKYEFNYGEVKLTKYGYIMDECPDTGSEKGYGNTGNMLVPLKSIAVAPETLKSGMVKKGDVLIITCTDKGGNTWIERRKVADQSGSGLLGSKYKFLIDEFVPTNAFKSKLAGRSDQLKLSIQIADTKEPPDKWNVQEASQYAPMFLCRNDWERVRYNSDANYKKLMDTEYIKYVKWDSSETIYDSFVTHPGCTKGTAAWKNPNPVKKV